MNAPSIRTPPPARALSPAALPPWMYVFTDVIDELRFNQRWRPDRCAAGLLCGHAGIAPDTDTPFVIVRGFVAGTHVNDSDEFIRYLRLQWKAATSSMQYHFPHDALIGWYFAPTSARDPGPEEELLHNTFFNHPWQAGLWLPPDGAPIALRPAGAKLAAGGVLEITGPKAADAR